MFDRVQSSSLLLYVESTGFLNLGLFVPHSLFRIDFCLADSLVTVNHCLGGQERLLVKILLQSLSLSRLVSILSVNLDIVPVHLVLGHRPRVKHLDGALLPRLPTLIAQADSVSVGFTVAHVLVKQILDLVVNFLLAHLPAHVRISEVHICARHLDHQSRLLFFLCLLLVLVKSWLSLHLLCCCFLILGEHGDHGLYKQLFELGVCLVALIDLAPDVGELSLQGVDLVNLVSILLQFLFHSCDVSMSQISLPVPPLGLLRIFAVQGVHAGPQPARLPVPADVNRGVLQIRTVEYGCLVGAALAFLQLASSFVITSAVCIEMTHDLV